MVSIDSGTQMTTFLEMGSVGGKATDQVPVIIGQMTMGAGKKEQLRKEVKKYTPPRGL